MNCPACDHPNVDGARYCAKCGALMPVGHIDGNDPMIGSVVGGRYRITGLLGEGGMGRVYVGEQQMGTAVRKVAIKTLLPEFSKDPQVVRRFMQECGTVVELEHANTIKFYDFGQTDSGELYIAMEYVAGHPLSEDIEKYGAMGFDRVTHIMKQVCGSLHEGHEKGLVHRDVKPENVMLCERAGEKDFVKVLDFGIAKRQDAVDSAREQKLTQAGMVLGTPPYMSPEQFTGKELDRRSDIYALGVMAYEMLTGQLPFKANTPWEWATQHMTVQPSPFEGTGPMAAQIPPSMKAACMKALSKDASERQSTSKQFYAELAGGGVAQTAGATSATATAVDVGGKATEAFSVPMGGPAPAMGAAGKTQIGEPFVPPPDAVGGGGIPGPGVSPMDYGGGSPHQHVPTGGGQAVPAAPAHHSRGGGGNKGILIAAAGGVALLLVVGLVIAFSGGGDETGDEDPIIPIATTEPETGDEATDGDGDTDTDTGDTDTAATPPDPTSVATNTTTTTTQTKTQTKTETKPADGTEACDAAIAAALGGNCSAARSKLTHCSGFKRSTAVANVNSKCSGTTQPQPKPQPTHRPKIKLGGK